MSKARNNALLAIAIVAGLLSLPTTWLTIRSTDIRITPQFGGQILTPESDFSSLLKVAVNKSYVEATGLNGHVTFLVKLPIWLIISIAIIAGVCQLADNLSGFDFPRPLLWAVALIAVFLVLLTVTVGLISGRAMPGIGWLLGAVCATIPVATLWMPRRKIRRRSHTGPAAT